MSETSIVSQMQVAADEPHGIERLSAFCPRFHHAVELIGRRWSGAILRAMFAGGTRFSDIAATVPGLSDRLLSERLKELTAEGLVERVAHPDSGRVEYHLTEMGRELAPVIDCLSDWANRWVDAVCDTPASTDAPDVVTDASSAGASRA